MQHNTQLDLTINNLPIGITLFDPTGKVLFTNIQGANYLGYTSREDLLAQKSLNSMRVRLLETFVIKNESGDLFTANQSPVVLAMTEKIPHEYTAHFLHKKTGEESWAIAHANPIMNEKNELIMIVYSLTDITKQKQHEKQLNDFLSIASHELKTPITSVKLYSQILGNDFRKKGDEKSAIQLEKMHVQINKLNNLISDLLDVTKIQAGMLGFQKIDFDIDELIAEVIEEINLTTSTHELIYQKKHKKIITADRQKISQVLINLISNAIKYSPESNKVIISTILEKNEIIISVQDFGFGISKDEQLKIFEKFFRIKAKTDLKIAGVGLGLFISAQIIKEHDGKIWVESTLGKGSTFYFSLPFKNNQ